MDLGNLAGIGLPASRAAQLSGCVIDAASPKLELGMSVLARAWGADSVDAIRPRSIPEASRCSSSCAVVLSSVGHPTSRRRSRRPQAPARASVTQLTATRTALMRCLFRSIPLTLLLFELGCAHPTTPTQGSTSINEAATKTQATPASPESDECRQMRDVWMQELASHQQCERDSDCMPTGLRNTMPTGLRNTHYECTAVNAEWWRAERDRLAGLAGACSRIHTKTPACCVVSCRHGTCITHSQAADDNDDYCSADGGLFVCHHNARCEMNRERLWCGVALAPDWGYCVKPD